MGQKEISIILDNPAAYYLPGAWISGTVVINTRREQKTRGLRIQLEGNAHVRWVKSKASRVSKKNVRTKVYEDTQQIILLSDDLLGDGDVIGIHPAGKVVYPFKFHLHSMNLPCTHHSSHGRVEYNLTATMDRQGLFSFDYTASQAITVGALLDLNRHPVASRSVKWSSKKKMGILGGSILRMQVKLGAQGYCPGDVLRVPVKFSEDTSKSVEGVIAKLVERTTFSVEGRKGIKQCEKIVVTTDATRVIENGHEWEGTLQLSAQMPPTQLGGGCKIIALEYILKVRAKIGLYYNMTLECPVIIGTVPFGKEAESKTDIL